MIGNHFKKKFSKILPPGIIVTEVSEREFWKNRNLGTAISKKSKTLNKRRSFRRSKIEKFC